LRYFQDFRGGDITVSSSSDGRTVVVLVLSLEFAWVIGVHFNDLVAFEVSYSVTGMIVRV